MTPFYEHNGLEREKQRMRGWAAKAETLLGANIASAIHTNIASFLPGRAVTDVSKVVYSTMQRLLKTTHTAKAFHPQDETVYYLHLLMDISGMLPFSKHE